MKRFSTLAVALVILMAGFMSVCMADDNCITEPTHTSTHGAEDLHASNTTTKNTNHDHCGMLCHIAPYSIPQVTPNTLASSIVPEGRITSTDTTLSLGINTVPDQPPRA